MNIRKATSLDYKNIIALMQQMSDFFSPETVEYAQEIINELKGFVVYENDILLGFIIFGKLKEDTTKIYRMGVEKNHQGKGIGTALFIQGEQATKKEGIKQIQLLTLGDHPDYPGYAKTRKFYEKMGCKKTSSYMDHDIEILTLTKKLQE